MPTPNTTNIDNHAERAIERLPGYQQDGINWGKLLRAAISEIQALEDALDQLENERHLSDAIGQQLDELGTILDEPRNSRSDDDYRFALQGKAAALAGSGEGDRVLDGYLFLLQAISTTITELQPATVELNAIVSDDTFTASEDTAILSAMVGIKAAGVGMILMVCVEPCFLWGAAADTDANGDLPSNTTGFGDDADADANGDILPGVGGGNLARLLT